MAKSKTSKSVKAKVRVVLTKDGMKPVVTAEDRWNLSGRMRPETPLVPNEHLIQEMISTGRNRKEITEALLLFPRNIDCILDQSQRLAVCEWLGVKEATEAERVQYINDQVVKSSSGGESWLALLSGKSISNLSAYHSLRYKRLDEQVGRGLFQEKCRRIRNAESGSASTGGALLPSQIVDADIQRDATGMSGMDVLGGCDEGSDNYGFCAGDLVLVGGEPGVGKTKVLIAMAACASSPQRGHVVVYNQGEFPLPTFKTKYCNGVLRNDEALYLADKKGLGEILDMMYTLRPRFIILDSKDKINECVNQAGWKRTEKRLRTAAMDIGATVFIVTHLNGKGGIKGGRGIEHDVDVVMHIRKIPEAGVFEVSMEGKNRSGESGMDRKSIFRHMGRGVICVKEAARYRSAGVIDDHVKNPLLVEIPESVSAEEDLIKEENLLLSKIHEFGIDSLSEEERQRLGHITEWKIKKDDPEFKERLKQQKKDKKQEERESLQNEEEDDEEEDDNPRNDKMY